ncbi:MAG TPA: AMP-binding protein, partial [Gaiellaceae bacterium]|nr:AMP-binding protein [Gaiellaceae bacterium]
MSVSERAPAAAARPAEPRGAVQSGRRRLSLPRLYERAARAASGFAETGGAVALLLRNDIAFLEAAFAASFAGTHSVPLNWHSKPGEIEHVLSDSGATHLVVHADLLRPIADSVPPDVAVLCVPTPPEVRRAYGTALDEAVPPPGYPVWDRWLR